MSAMYVPRGLSLFAALAVSGTALYLVYGYKKRCFLDIRRGKGSLRVEYRPVQALTKDPALAVELTEGKEIGTVDRRPQRRSRRHQTFLLLPTPVASREEEELRVKLAKCSADADLVKSLHTTLTSYKITDQVVEQFETTNRNSSCNPSESFERFDRMDIRSAPSDACEGDLERNKRLSGFSSIPSSSPPSDEDDCRLKSSTSSLAFDGDNCCSKSSSPPSSPSDEDDCNSKSIFSPSKPVLVGCFASSGIKEAGKSKKVVRFSPTVVEPSSNNDEYRRRCKSEIAQRTTTQAQPSEAIRSIAFKRPRLYSQAAKHTITYNIHRTDGRYSSRSYY